MSSRMRSLAIGLLLLTPFVLPANSVQDVLEKMDASSASFSTMTAGLKKTSYTKVIDDTSEESGTIVLKRHKPKDLQVLINFTQPDPRTIAFRGKKAEIYLPKAKTISEYDLAQYSGLTEQFLLVGFGTSGKDLAANYDIKLAGDDEVEGKKAVKLDLTPKNATWKDKLTKLELWLADGGSYPVRQKLIQPSGDSTTFTYTDVKMNSGLSNDALALKVPKGVKREFPQR